MTFSTYKIYVLNFPCCAVATKAAKLKWAYYTISWQVERDEGMISSKRKD